MSSPWQPKQQPGSALVYRTHFSTHAPDLRRQAAEQFSAWLGSKGLPVTAESLLHGASAETVAADGTQRAAQGSVATFVDRGRQRELRAVALRLTECLRDGSTWTTSVTVATPIVTEQGSLFADPPREPQQLFELTPDTTMWPEQPWAWLDLEHVPADGSPIRPGSPRLVRDLLAAVEGTDGTLPLTSDVLDITENHVNELCGWLFDTTRRVPVIVFTPDPVHPDAQERFGNRLARDVAGVAVVVRLVDAVAASAFSRSVGPHLQVYGGAMRTYLPGLRPNEPFPKRHRVLSAATMRAMGPRAANAVRDQVLSLSTRRTPPPSYPLVQLLLAQASAHRRRIERPQPARPSTSHQPTLIDIQPKQATLPGLDERLPVARDTTLTPSVATHEANVVLRTVLGGAGVDLSAVLPTTPHSNARSVEAEHRALQQVVLGLARSARSVAADFVQDSGLTGKLAESEELNTLLYADIEVLSDQLREQQKSVDEVEGLRFEREFAELELTEAEREADRLRARIRWLETELAKSGQHKFGIESPQTSLPDPPASVADAIELAPIYLPYLELGDTAQTGADLDVHPQGERWGIKIWQALVALNDYACARSTGAWSNSFHAWCQAPPPGGAAIPATWVALKESETTDTMPKLRAARTFQVPVKVDSSGKVYMAPHVKIQQGGSPCPRIHFHDDAGGQTGKVYVGYIGDHLPTANFA
ncbi:hypothetical protein ACFFX1_31380 [Dactylosporangium sucinum]|uniref:Uncharacterized protein n=1 Tax=Dactylosporangium sucinum TaxID=1424081 RepID=A0A917TW27_9ACTN|nr:hypothetical protein [Dactylosporangium sucinum]GGM40038.1 hypothetical protein GCM10007977_046760 [Dactylosporangium sucinum]